MPDPALPERVTDPDGRAVEIFALPTDPASLEELLRDLFEKHWAAITFGTIIQGAAWEITAPHAPSYVGMFDGYLTVAFGVSHFHLCIAPTAGSKNDPTPAALARHRQTARAELYRALDREGTRSPGACASSMARTSSSLRCCCPIHSCRRIPGSSSRTRIGRGLPCGTGCGHAGPAQPGRTRSTAPRFVLRIDRSPGKPGMTSSTNSDRAISLLLVAAAIAGSFWFACVTPFPALAVVAAYALAPRAALLAVIGAWIANQAVGFNFLGYPQDANTILWGLAIGGGAAVATLLAAEAMRRASPNRAIATVTGFAIAFATYEALLFLASFGLGGAGGFAPSVVGQFALLNLAWTAGLIGILELSRYGRAIGKGAPTPAP